MKFAYEYRTPDNVRHTGIVEAADREAAFQSLRGKGIRPARLTDAPGFFNRLFGRGKRWLTIGVLGVFCLVLFVLYHKDKSQLSALSSQLVFEDRAQIFGDPAVLQKLSQDGWRAAFPDEGEAFLARHAIPGKLCDCGRDRWNLIASALVGKKDISLDIHDSDPEELRKMKRLINGMKREFSDYVAFDGNQPSAANLQSETITYMSKCCERCRVEKGVYDGIARDLEAFRRQLRDSAANRAKILSDWDKKNAALRAMGLATIPQPE